MASEQNTIGAYEVVDEIGRGGMGVVYKVRHQTTGRLCALKMVLPENMREETDRLRFKREFRAMQRVNHPNVVRVFESGSERKRPYFTMELIHGIPLFDWLDGQGNKLINRKKKSLQNQAWPQDKLDALNNAERIERIRSAFEQIAQAMAAIHQHRIVHRDLKPDNIFVTHEGRIKIMDFGIAKTLGNHGEFSSGRLLVGTYRYLAPEQALGIRVDTRADLYCLGVLLYEAVAGRHPYFSETDVGYAFHHARTPAPSLTHFNPQAPSDLVSLIAQLMNKEPTKRLASASEMAFLLRSPLENTDAELAQDLLDGGPIIFEPALVGRDAELKTFSVLCKKTSKGKGKILWLNGPENIGKSRLLEQALAIGRSQNLDVFVSYCDAEDKSPFHPYIKIIDKMVRLAQNLPATMLNEFLGKHRAVLAAHVPSLRRLNDPLAPHHMDDINTQHDPNQFFQAVWYFLSRYANARPILIAIDDFHAADELSIHLTEQIAKRLSRRQADRTKTNHLQMSLLFTADVDKKNTARMRPLMEKLSHIHGYEPLPLRPLSVAQVGEVVGSMLGGAAIAQVIQHKIHRDTEGMPGLVENQVRVWVDSGFLQRQNRVWVISRQQQLNDSLSINRLPSQEITNIVDISRVTQADLGDSDELSVFQEKRLEGLSEPAQQILPYLAVIGQRTSFIFLKRVVPFAEDLLLDAINELLEEQIVQEGRDRQDYVLASTDRKLLLRTLGEKNKKRIHQQIAEGLIQRAQAMGAPLPHERIAAHMLAGGHKNKALLHWVYGAQQALQSSANETAAELIRNAHGILKSNQASFETDILAIRAEFELTLLRLQALERIGNHASCAKLARRRQKTYEAKQSYQNLARFWIQMGESLAEIGELDEAQGLAERVLQIQHAPKLMLQLRSRAHRLCGKIYARKGSYEKSVLCLQKALTLSRNLELHSDSEQAQSALAFQHFWAGYVVDAKKDFTDLWERAQKRQDTPLIIRYTYMLGEIARAQNKPQLAERFFRKSISIAKPVGNRLAVANGLAAISLVKSINNATDALTICRQSIQIFKDLNNPKELAHAQLIKARLQIKVNESQKAADTLEKVIELAKSLKDQPLELEAWLRLVLMYAQENEMKETEALWPHVQSLASSIDNHRLQLLKIYVEAQCAFSSQNFQQARHLVHLALNRPIPTLARSNFFNLQERLNQIEVI